MTDKMPDEIYVNDELLYPSPIDSYYEGWISFTDEKDGYKYISEQKHTEEIAALRAEHRAEMAGLCDEIGTMKGRFHEMSPEEYGFSIACADCIELIEQRISDE